MQTLFEVNYCSVTGQMTDVILSEAKNLGVAGQMLRLPAQHDSSSDYA